MFLNGEKVSDRALIELRIPLEIQCVDQPERASTANYKFVSTRDSFYPERPTCPIGNDKNALPRFDEESQLTHQAEEEQCVAGQPKYH